MGSSLRGGNHSIPYIVHVADGTWYKVCAHVWDHMPSTAGSATPHPLKPLVPLPQGNHIYTSGAMGTNAAVIKGALRADAPDLLTVILPQSRDKQLQESQELLQQVQAMNVLGGEGRILVSWKEAWNGVLNEA